MMKGARDSARTIGNPGVIGLTVDRSWVAVGLVLLTLCFVPAQGLLHLAIEQDYYDGYILVIPILSVLLVWMDRVRIFERLCYSPLLGAALGLVGILIHLEAGRLSTLQTRAWGLSLATLSAVVLAYAGFVTCCGTQAMRRAVFPLVFLLLSIPLPPAAMNLTVLGLQNGSAAFSTVLFKVFHVPALREGLKFSLPGLDIEIKEHCSGIRSMLGLAIASLLTGRFFMRTWWKQLALVALTIPLVIFKNAVRIVTISCLGIYLDRRFLQGPLHDYGGLVFSLIDFVVLTPVAYGLYRWDKQRYDPRLDTNTTVLTASS
jgi:exosortase